MERWNTPETACQEPSFSKYIIKYLTAITRKIRMKYNRRSPLSKHYDRKPSMNSYSTTLAVQTRHPSMYNQSSGDGSIGYIVLYFPVREKNIFGSTNWYFVKLFEWGLKKIILKDNWNVMRIMQKLHSMLASWGVCVRACVCTYERGQTAHERHQGIVPPTLCPVIDIKDHSSLLIFSNISFWGRVKGICGQKSCQLVRLILHKIVYLIVEIVTKVCKETEFFIIITHKWI